MPHDLHARFRGALYGGAIGDGIGAPVEGLRRTQILDLVGPVRGFIAPTEQIDGQPTLRPGRPDGKGDGRITDDTLMVEALIAAYIEHGDHLDALAYRDVFAPILGRQAVWLPERQCDMVVLDRLASAEQWHIRSLLNTHRDARFFGSSLHNITCGAAMCAWPIGAVNAGDPRGAYDEAVAFFAAQTFSFGLEQAAVMAAAIAEAIAPDATPRRVVDVALSVACDATGSMIHEAVEALEVGAGRDRDLPAVHAAVQRWHHKRTHVPDTNEHMDAAEQRSAPSNRGMESRLHTSEEMPVALAMLLRADGAFEETVCAAAEYGEDADSIAGMAGSLAGALHGVDAIPSHWREYADKQNRRDYAQLADGFTDLARRIAGQDQQRHQRRWACLRAGRSPAD